MLPCRIRWRIFLASSLLLAGCAGELAPSDAPPAPSGGPQATPAALAASSGGPVAGAADATLHGQYDVIAADTTDLYVAGFDGIVRVPKGGGTPVPLTDEQGFKDGLAIDAEHVYFSRLVSGEIVRLPKRGGAAEVVASHQVRPWGIVVDDDAVYWACQGDEEPGVEETPPGGAIAKVSKKGGDVVVLAPGEQTPVSLTLDGDWVYFADGVWGDDNGSIRRVPRAGGAVQTLASRRATTGVPGIAVTGGRVTWTEDGTAFGMPVEGGAIVALGPAATLAGDGRNVYLATADDRRLEILAGGEPLPLRSRTFTDDETWFVQGLVSDRSGVYWLDSWWSYRDPGPYSGVHTASR
jgi:hypothetical protein